MQSVKTRTLSSDASMEQTFAALLGTVQNGRYDISGLNNEHHKLVFTSGKTALSWGQEYVAEVRPAGDKAMLTLSCGGVDGRPKALLDGWKNNRAADKVLSAVGDVLAGTTTAPVTPQDSFATTEDGSTVPWTGPDLPEG